MFAYCLNNPVNMRDSAGGRPVWETYENDTIGYTDSGTGGSNANAADDQFNYLDFLWSQMSTPSQQGGTFSVGFTGSYTAGQASGSVNYSATVDTGYNYALQRTVGNGVESEGLGASAGLTLSYTNATYATDLNGSSTSFGVSFENFSVDFITFSNDEAFLDTCIGLSVTFGVGLGFGYHFATNSTSTSAVWNPFG